MTSAHEAATTLMAFSAREQAPVLSLLSTSLNAAMLPSPAREVLSNLDIYQASISAAAAAAAASASAANGAAWPATSKFLNISPQEMLLIQTIRQCPSMMWYSNNSNNVQFDHSAAGGVENFARSSSSNDFMMEVHFRSIWKRLETNEGVLRNRDDEWLEKIPMATLQQLAAPFGKKCLQLFKAHRKRLKDRKSKRNSRAKQKVNSGRRKGKSAEAASAEDGDDFDGDDFEEDDDNAVGDFDNDGNFSLSSNSSPSAVCGEGTY